MRDAFKSHSIPSIQYFGGENIVRHVEVKLKEGVKGLALLALVAEAQANPNEIKFLPSKSPVNAAISAKSLPDLFSLSIKKGDYISIFVKDFPNTNGERVVKRIYSALTTEGSIPDFDREVYFR